MTKIGLLSDTHGYLDPRVFDHFAECDEIWHAGDIGTITIVDQLTKFKSLRAVHGNIDGYDIRYSCPTFLRFRCEKVNVLLTHIGGYPNHFSIEAKALLKSEVPDLFVCGHSHILKVQYDSHLNMLCVNPGAAGRYGFHTVQTLLRFTIDGNKINDMEVIELSAPLLQKN
jgi:putative phosphoesterase